MQTIYYLGMAKSCLDLKGAKSVKVELDLLRLIYAVKELSNETTEVKAFMIIANNSIKERMQKWLNRYKTSQNKIEIVLLNDVLENENCLLKLKEVITDKDDLKKLKSIIEKNNYLETLKAEKLENAKANIRHIDSSISKKSAIGNWGKKIFEYCLSAYILNYHPDIKNQNKKPNSQELPFDINWDFYHLIQK